jgi:hypothetical protein
MTAPRTADGQQPGPGGPPPTCRDPGQSGHQPDRALTAFKDPGVLARVLAGLYLLPDTPLPHQGQAITATPTATPSTTPAERACFLRLQALEDAIAYRLARLAAPCPGCGPQHCDDHAVDVTLIAAYREATHQTALVLHAQR